jgi:alkylation response protein AidB-like acyl-CoA dehydrogenase
MKKCLKKAGSLGFLGLSIPEEYGGMGLPFNTSLLCGNKLGQLESAFCVA